LNPTGFSPQTSMEHFVAAAAEKLAPHSQHLTSLNYFCDLASQILHPPALKKARDEGRKVIGYYCAMVPLELIAAFDAVPVRLCAGLPEDRPHGLPRDCCPVVRSSCGLVGIGKASLWSEIEAVIVPSVCDWKTQFAEIIAGHFPTLTLPIAFKKREASARRERLENVSKLLQFLAEVTGQEFSRDRLFRSIQTYQKANYATRQLADLMLSDCPPFRGSDLLLVMNVSFYDDISSWTEAAMRLVADAEKGEGIGADCSKRSPRILLTGAPIIWPNWKLPEIIEDAGATIVAEELCSGARVFYDPVRIDERTTDDMLQAIAERYSLACTCPCFVPNDDRVYRNVALARRYRVDGVIYHNLRTCYLYHMECGILRKRFQELETPFLEIETDHSLEDREQVAVRVEPFVEMLRRKGD
jgi:benzoyl-CoA reductase/2-hydroxyglutaryl-CoA dehydratase subunit BcrC/BadD/HgdB